MAPFKVYSGKTAGTKKGVNFYVQYNKIPSEKDNRGCERVYRRKSGHDFFIRKEWLTKCCRTYQSWKKSKIKK